MEFLTNENKWFIVIVFSSKIIGLVKQIGKILNLYSYSELEIKPCGLGSRIRDMEADLIYW